MVNHFWQSIDAILEDDSEADQFVMDGHFWKTAY